VISFLKYTPAAYWNYKRKSTKGWSIFNIILDLVGGTFSLASGTLSTSNGVNITKVVLAGVTVLYDFLFIFQHYCLYKQRNYGDVGSVLVDESDVQSKASIKAN
jgi:cystinosin